MSRVLYVLAKYLGASRADILLDTQLVVDSLSADAPKELYLLFKNINAEVQHWEHDDMGLRITIQNVTLMELVDFLEDGHPEVSAPAMDIITRYVKVIAKTYD